MKTEKARLVQLVHIGKQQLNIDDESYRAMLKRLTNKTSSTKCTVVELHKVLHELQSKGAKVTWFAKSAKKPTAYSPATGETKVKSEITHKIRAVWITMGKHGFLKDPSEQALNAYVRKVINKNRKTLVLNVGALESNEAAKMLEILKKWHKRLMIKGLSGETYTVDPKISYDALKEWYDEVV